MSLLLCFFFLQAEDGIRDLVRSRGLGDVYKRQRLNDCLQVDSQWVLFSAPVDDSSIDIDVQRFLSSVRGTSEGDWRAAAVIP